MKEKILPWGISVALTGCLISGILFAQQFAFYALLAFNVIAWIGVFALSAMGKDTWLKITRFPVMTWALTSAQIFALAYSGHPALAASSLICSMMIYSGALFNLKKESSE